MGILTVDQLATMPNQKRGRPRKKQQKVPAIAKALENAFPDPREKRESKRGKKGK